VILWIWQWTFGFHRIRRHFWLAKRLSDYLENVCCMVSVNVKNFPHGFHNKFSYICCQNSSFIDYMNVPVIPRACINFTFPSPVGMDAGCRWLLTLIRLHNLERQQGTELSKSLSIYSPSCRCINWIGGAEVRNLTNVQMCTWLRLWLQIPSVCLNTWKPIPDLKRKIYIIKSNRAILFMWWTLVILEWTWHLIQLHSAY
jgi:hypothetical protein